MSKITSIFDKLDIEGMINFQQIQSNKRTEKVIKRLDELNKRLEKALKVEDELERRTQE